jgi:maltose O-acetyltransferase
MVERLIAKGMTVGRKCSIQEGVVFDESYCWLISLGDNVTLAPFAYLLAHDASMIKHLGYARIGRVCIEDGVFVGARVVILPGVTIGKNSIIGAGSIVSHSIPPDVVVAGNPANVICDLATFILRHREAMEEAPCFSLIHKMNCTLDPKLREEMSARIGQNSGYIV